VKERKIGDRKDNHQLSPSYDAMGQERAMPNQPTMTSS